MRHFPSQFSAPPGLPEGWHEFQLCLPCCPEWRVMSPLNTGLITVTSYPQTQPICPQHNRLPLLVPPQPSPAQPSECLLCLPQLHDHAGRVILYKTCVPTSEQTQPLCLLPLAVERVLWQTLWEPISSWLWSRPTRLLFLYVGGGRYYFWGLCKPPQIN